MSSNTVRDRSGAGLPSKAERRALGKAAARKRAIQRRRRELRNRIAQIAAPVAVVAVIVAAVWFFSGGDDPATDPVGAASDPAGATSDPTAPTTDPTPEFARADSLDPALETEPVVPAGEGTVSELEVTTIVAGTGPVVEAGNTVEAHYIGAFYATGEVFDSSWERGAPAQFDLDGVIEGWSQGLVGVTVGSRVQLDIPFALAYEGSDPNRYPQGDLRFIVDIHGVRA